MKRIFSILYTQRTSLLVAFLVLIIFGIIRWFFDGLSVFNQIHHATSSDSSNYINQDPIFLYRRQKCLCTRPVFGRESNRLIIDESSTSLCSHYSTLRGFHQKIIAISMYGPKENAMFGMNQSVHLLHELIVDMKQIYPDWILRIYHDVSIGENIICSIECDHNHVDFCNASALGSLGSVSNYIPPKIWRFLPAGDLLVDMMASRDLDSPLVQRELDAVNDWLSTNKSWHVMRDHPLHTVPMLGGMWGFRPVLNRTFARIFLDKILNRTLVSRYGGRADQTFLTDHVWSDIQMDVIAHDSHLCTTWYGKNSQPWPTRRPSLNESGCFVGCVRPCCQISKFPFGECPLACRPKNHPNWTMC